MGTVGTPWILESGAVVEFLLFVNRDTVEGGDVSRSGSLISCASVRAGPEPSHLSLSFRFFLNWSKEKVPSCAALFWWYCCLRFFLSFPTTTLFTSPQLAFLLRISNKASDWLIVFLLHSLFQSADTHQYSMHCYPVAQKLSVDSHCLSLTFKALRNQLKLPPPITSTLLAKSHILAQLVRSFPPNNLALCLYPLSLLFKHTTFL